MTLPTLLPIWNCPFLSFVLKSSLIILKVHLGEIPPWVLVWFFMYFYIISSYLIFSVCLSHYSVSSLRGKAKSCTPKKIPSKPLEQYPILSELNRCLWMNELEMAGNGELSRVPRFFSPLFRKWSHLDAQITRHLLFLIISRFFSCFPTSF